VYEGIALLTARDFAGAAALLLDSLATFTAHEVISYERFILLTVVAALKTLERPALKKRVVDSPDVLSVIDGVPHLGELLGAFGRALSLRFAAEGASLALVDVDASALARTLAVVMSIVAAHDMVARG
jgi:hypothetical protein